MSLRLLAGKLDIDRPFHGIQAHGINEGETPYPTLREMASADIDMIRALQPEGPYMLWGYSFGARVAFEAAWQLERSGAQVEHLFLIAPGAPRLATRDQPVFSPASGYGNKAFVTILFSVFARTITGSELDDCLAATRDEDSFVAFIAERFGNLGPDLLRRIVRIVHRTYEFAYSSAELAERALAAPVTIIRARGDAASFLESAAGSPARAPVVLDLDADHYGMLGKPGVDQLVAAIERRLHHADTDLVPAPDARGEAPRPSSSVQEINVPHVNIKYFPVSLSQQQQSELVANLTRAVQAAFGCDESVISIALEPVAKESWQEQVYVPEIVNRKDLLCKVPSY
jgi:thioesterase domain-containing protein/phenylpyruvate tautomerase PptA (4-oxalocrotonate tautomerase family)